MPDMNMTFEQQQMLAKAEAAVEKLSAGYVPILLGELDKLSAELEAGNDEEALILAHTIQGQAGTFGWPMVTEAAHHLHQVIEAQANSPISSYTIKSIIDTIHMMLKNGLKGHTPQGKKLVADIVSMVNATPT
ncbi:MAG: Hpt domain-containing protein [Kordiimonas sp.]